MGAEIPSWQLLFTSFKEELNLNFDYFEKRSWFPLDSIESLVGIVVEWKNSIGESGVRDPGRSLFFSGLGFHYIQNQANSDSKDEERPVGVVVELMIKGGSPRFVFLLFYEYKSGDPH